MDDKETIEKLRKLYARIREETTYILRVSCGEVRVKCIVKGGHQQLEFIGAMGVKRVNEEAE